ncbi:MAG: dienelactone hydrolase family protein [Planctomycetota bacterium]
MWLRSLAVLSLLAFAPLQDPAPAPAKDPVKERLEKSPRHHEWVEVKSGERTLHCFVSYPETKGKVGAVLVIHENKGLNDWARAVSDEFAEAGYIAIAPDLLSGAGPTGGKTDSFASADAATEALYKLDAAKVSADLAATADYATKLESCNGKLSVAGFCWGGGKSFAFASARKDLKSAFVFYGSAPTEEAMAKIECPVYGFYGENDSRITSSVAATTEAMKKLGKTFEPVTYEGAGHGFMRAGEALDASEPNKRARAEAWTRIRRLLGS